jgi:hypothetical protein
MVGTPPVTVTLSVWITCRYSIGLKRGSRVMGAPQFIADSSTLTRPNTWNSGSAVAKTSSGVPPQASQHILPVATRLSTVRMAPFGLPVVPEV